MTRSVLKNMKSVTGAVLSSEYGYLPNERGQMKHIFCALIATALLSAPAIASSSGIGNITDVWGTSNGAVLFNMTGTRTAVPTCGANNPQRFAIDASTVAGQAAVAVLLSAQARGKAIEVSGMGTCTIWGDTETVSFFWVQP